MPYSWVEALGVAQAWLADRFRTTGNHAWLIPWSVTRRLFIVACAIRYGRGTVGHS